jgi:hypothetical protein
MILPNKTSKVKTTGGYRTKGAKDKHKRCTRGFRRSNSTGQCEPAQYFIKSSGPDNTLFSNDLIGDLSKSPEVKQALRNKGVAFLTRSQFMSLKTFQSYIGNNDKLIEKIGYTCEDVVASEYIEETLNEVLEDDEPNPYMDILFIKNRKQKILGFLIAELGACRTRPQTYAINLVCSESGLGKLLVGACLYCIRFNENVATKACVLELAHAYRNTTAFFVYSRMGFNVDNSLISDNCFHDAQQLPMSVKLTDKYTKQYIANAMVRADFKQIDVHDNTGIYDLGLPLKYSEDKGNSEDIQEKMVLIANIIRKMKVYSNNEKYGYSSVALFPTDEWEYIKKMKMIKVEKIPITSQSKFRKHLYDHREMETKFMKELDGEFSETKEDYKKSKIRVKIEK